VFCHNGYPALLEGLSFGPLDMNPVGRATKWRMVCDIRHDTSTVAFPRYRTAELSCPLLVLLQKVHGLTTKRKANFCLTFHVKADTSMFFFGARRLFHRSSLAWGRVRVQVSVIPKLCFASNLRGHVLTRLFDRRKNVMRHFWNRTRRPTCSLL
jgi:hypothetical protein